VFEVVAGVRVSVYGDGGLEIHFMFKVGGGGGGLDQDWVQG
jgi:hypothetical protein